MSETKENGMTHGIVGPMSKGVSFIVHAIDCADCKRDAKKCGNAPDRIMTTEASTYEEVVEEVYGPDEFLYDPETEMSAYISDFHFAPCCQLTHREEA